MSYLLWMLAVLLGGDQAKPSEPSLAISGVETQEPVVALTFDACATKQQANGFDEKIFEILERENIPVTIFMTGTWAEKHPGPVKRIAAADWIEIGNHSYSHPRLTLLEPARLRDQIRYTNRILQDRLGRPAMSLRPPAGAWNQAVLRAAHQESLPLVLWSVVSGDAGGHIPAEHIRRIVLEQTKPGSIVIFHINNRAPFTKKALPDIIAGLRAKGFRFATVSQLLALPDAKPLGSRTSSMGYRSAKSRAAPAEAEPLSSPPPPLAHPPLDTVPPNPAKQGTGHENSPG